MEVSKVRSQFVDKNDIMSFRIVIVFAVAVIGSQVSAQMGGIVRPFATGFTNGFAEVAKPFVQFGQSVVSPANDYISGQKFPYFPQMMTYPSKIVPQAQGTVYEGIDATTAGFPGANYFQAVRPPVMKPQNQFYQIPNQPAYVRPIRPLPAVVDESEELHRPSNLLMKPELPEEPKSEEILDAGFAGPSAQITQKKE